MKRPPLTIWRYAAVELWRLVILTTSILVVVIVFAAAVRYTAAGKLGPLETLRFMWLAMVPMLQYALPFAAGFAATLAYHRMAQDNELKASAASGVSHRSLLMPAVVSGVFLSLLLGLLTANVIPGFLRDMQRMVTRDITKMIVGNIRSGQGLDLNGRMIHADSVRELGPEGPYSQVLLLTGVVGVEVDDQGKVAQEVTARQALIGFAPGHSVGGSEGGTGMLVTLVLRDGSWWQRDKAQGNVGDVRPYTVAMPGGMDDDPKFYTSGELKRLPEDPDRLNIIDSRRRELAYRIAERQFTATIDEALRASKRVRLLDQAGRSYVIHAAGVRWVHENRRWELSPLVAGEPVRVEMFREGSVGGAQTAFRAKAAGLASNMSTEPGNRSLTMVLEMDGVVAEAGETGGERKQITRANLAPAESPLPQLLEMSSTELLAKVAGDPSLAEDGFVAGPARELEKRIAKLEREILSKRHERAAISVSCLVMVVAGALSAMRLASSMPLTVYLWSFFPALVAVITISAGQQVTHQSGAGGLVILWGGVGLLVVYVAGAFWIVRKH